MFRFVSLLGQIVRWHYTTTEGTVSVCTVGVTGESGVSVMLAARIGMLTCYVHSSWQI